jgi:hypothetical protein
MVVVVVDQADASLHRHQLVMVGQGVAAQVVGGLKE